MDVDGVISSLARRQHGVVSRAQLLKAGVAGHRIDYRIRRGRLVAVHQGVYRAGPAAMPLEREMAAVLACGDSAFVSHGSAAAQWEFVRPRRREPRVDISIPGGRRRPAAGVRVHRVARPEPDEITRLHNLPIATPARALLDLAGCVGSRDLERALAAAERARLTQRPELERLVARYPRRPGSRSLRVLLGLEGGPTFTRSEAEERFLDLVVRGQLPRPQSNAVIQGYEVDFVWRAERLIVEIDGYEYHGNRVSFGTDRRRDSVLMGAGYRVQRVTWEHLEGEPEAVLVRLARALACGGAN